MSQFFRDPVTTIEAAGRTFGEVSGFSTLPHRTRCYVLALGPEMNRRVLGNPATFRTTGQGIAGPRGSAHRRLRHGLTQLNGDVHAEQRALVAPGFQRPAIEPLIGSMSQTIAAQLDKWPTGYTPDLIPYVQQTMRTIASEILFRRADPEQNNRLGLLLEEWIRLASSPSAMLFPVSLPGTAYRRMIEQAEGIEREILAMIDEKRRQPGNDVFSLLVHAYDHHLASTSLTILLGEASILYGASYETGATTLSWTLYLLAQHPDVARRIVAEIDEVVGTERPSAIHLSRLVYLERALKESMRICPPVPFTIRGLSHPTELAGIELKPGDRVFCSHYFTHRMPELYDQPGRFLPERWVTIKPSQYEYLPFSAGPRACIGYYFAMTALKLTLASILQRFRFHLTPNARIGRVVRVTMKPHPHLPMIISNTTDSTSDFRRVAVRGSVTQMVDLGQD